MNSTNTYKEIIANIPDSHYFDDEEYYRDVLKTDYEIITVGKFALNISFQEVFLGFKVGYVRGGMRFNNDNSSIEEFKNAVDEFQKILARKKYIYLIMEHLRTKSEFTEFFKNIAPFQTKKGTAIIYPKAEWLSKFKSKDRYNLTYAGKKGVEVKIFAGKEFNPAEDEKFYEFIEMIRKKSAGKYFFPDYDAICRLLKVMDCYIVLAENKDKYIALNISVFNPAQTRLERVFAGSDKNYASLRAPEYLELKFIEYLAQNNVNYYDLWMINEGDGFTDFKKKLADEIIEYAPRSIWYINKLIGLPYLFLSQIKAKLLN
jgi:lipid II:glycine glycyltransferase (peptidoglycan interpeptide bridge formation enzyme)